MPAEIKRYVGDKAFSCRPGAGGVWYIFWSENRRSMRQSTRAKSVGEAQAFFDEWLRLYGTEAGTQARLTCADLFGLKYPDPSERVRSAWKNLEPAFGKLTPAEVTPQLEAKYRRKRKVSPSTLRFELACLRAAWAEGVRRRLIASTDLPVLDSLPQPSPPRSRWLREDEVQRLLATAEQRSHRVWLFIWIALETAARRTAIQELRWNQVDFETGMIHFLPEGRQQTRKRRASVPISKNLRPVLEAAWTLAPAADGLVLGSARRINEPLAAVARAAGIEGVTPHVFRHTKATRMARVGVPLHAIAGVLGNTMEQVEKVYAKHTPEALSAAVNEERRLYG